MVGRPGFETLIPLLPVLLVHLAGVIVAVILLVRLKRRRGPAVLALVGFTLLLLLDLANFARGWLIGLIAFRTAAFGYDLQRGFVLASTGVGCCYSVLQVAGGLCLIVAIWQALVGTESLEVESEPAPATAEGE